MTLQEYMREIVLMERQYGQEEELYPLINMVLRENRNAKDLSIRTVADGKTNWGERNKKDLNTRDMLMGYSSFPDLVILQPDYDPSCARDIIDEYPKMLGCIEVKKFKINPTPNRTIDVLKDGEHTLKFFYYQYTAYIRKKGARYASYYYDFNKDESPELVSKFTALNNDNVLFKNIKWKKLMNKASQKTNIEITEEEKSTEKLEYKIIRKLKCEGLQDPDGDLEQFIGELLWYGKVLYTDGIIWKYIKLKDNNPEDNKNYIDRIELFKKCFKQNNNWIKEIAPKTVVLNVKTIGDLTPVINELTDTIGNDKKLCALNYCKFQNCKKWKTWENQYWEPLKNELNNIMNNIIRNNSQEENGKTTI